MLTQQPQYFQHGSLRLLKRARGPAVWEFRYRVTENGRRRLKNMLIGTARQFPTESLVRIKLQALIHKINGQSFFLNDPMLLCNVLIERFIMEERLETIAKDRPSQSPDGLRYSTARGYYRLLNQYIRPRWGNVPVDQVRPALVQQWLDEMPRSPKSKANIKALMHRLIDRGIFWGMVDL